MLSVYTRQFAVLVRAGIPLVPALESLARGDNEKLNVAFREVSRRVQNGSYLSQALASFPTLFPPFYLGLVQVGERSGSLSMVLDRLAENLERRERIRKRLVSALVYPVVLTVVSLALLLFLIAYILPLMEPMFAQVGTELPWLTRICLALAHALQRLETWAGLALIGVVIGLAGMQVAQAERYSPLRRSRDRLLLQLPGLGALLRYGTLSNLLRLFALLLSAGLEMRSSLALLRSTVQFHQFEESLQQAEDGLLEGEDLADALGRGEAFPRGCLQMIRVAEESGRVPQMLEAAAGLYEDNAETLVGTLVDLLEPLLLCAASILVGVVCVAVLLPWMQLLSKLT